MTNAFVAVLNMSITASYVAIAVMLVRLLLRRAPKIFSYLLWTAVIFRLAVPVSFTSAFSLLQLVQPAGHAGSSLGFIPQDIGMQLKPAADLGISSINRLVELPAAVPEASVNPVQVLLWAGSIIWLTGVVIILAYSAFSYIRILRRVRTATLVSDNIFETDLIMTPFVCGFVRPRIYIPAGLSGSERSYIILHEQTHIRRRDYLIKPFMFLLLILHWFNPLMWLSYALMSKDMEMSCDESVVNKLGMQIKGSYSASLLAFSMRSSGLPPGGPLAFVEGSVKTRITNILAYRPPSSRRTAGCLLLITALVAGCTANPKPIVSPQESLYSGYNVDKLIENRTRYVGDFSKVSALIGELPWPEGLEGAGIELQTGSRPYELTINYVMNEYGEVWDKRLKH
ncbi:M56 family metallopeptidase [Paenibacillus sp. MMS20-IR301]|uniref:M56 family metallopeptidase n=1 Tax=Paenibacillus sp. MMS20-IR301 TaxID=2895946 RepID=UPI0028F060BB|nr:M56 family metallopeptidase [Paenibacillus sp. MMS20-IR301]WNS45714.1 M56 family metallopeptidase [Paenibacillus sp. MMS20-IR301]